MENGMKITVSQKLNKYTCLEHVENKKFPAFSFTEKSGLNNDMNDARAYRAVAMYCLKKAYELEDKNCVSYFTTANAYNQVNKMIGEDSEAGQILEEGYLYAYEYSRQLEKKIYDGFDIETDGDYVYNKLLSQTVSTDKDDPDEIRIKFDKEDLIFSCYLESRSGQPVLVVDMIE